MSLDYTINIRGKKRANNTQNMKHITMTYKK